MKLLTKSIIPLFIGGMMLMILLEFNVFLQKDNAPFLESSIYHTQGIITIESTDHQKRDTSGSKPFSRFEGEALGLTEHNNFSVLEFLQPASRGRGIASGDFDNDGWDDILLGTNSGILVYKNLGNYKFALQDINLANISNLDLGVHVAVFVDINNDGWQDIYLTTYGGRNYFLLNDTKGFKSPKLLEVPNKGAVLTSAVSFGDLDKDGDLDFVDGNWTTKLTDTGAEINKLVRNNDLEFVEEDLAGQKGQTLSVLFSDFNNDNSMDLIAGDEFHNPDNFYIGDGEGGLREIKKSDGVIPASSSFNMGIDVADFNNDLYMDIYISGVSTYDISPENPCFVIQNNEERQKCERNIKTIDISREKNLEKCATLERDSDKNGCATIVVSYAAVSQPNIRLCDKISEEYALHRLMCRGMFINKPHIAADDIEGLVAFALDIESGESISQLPWQNILLEGGKNGFFREVAEEKNVNSAYNSWNAKFADLDNDEWQDIYVATGELIWWGSVFQPNIFFHNYEGKYFKTEQDEFGLDDINIVPSYTYIDIDNDGDLDVVTVPINGPLNVYINNQTTNNSVTFEFRDKRGNHFGIGNKIYIYYGDERHQVREIKSGGGFLSFDAPIAHFGLGKYDIVNKVEIIWSTGEKTVIDKEFLANKKYVISRGH